MRFLHCADTHLDNSFKSLASVQGAPIQRRKDLREVFLSIANCVKANDAILWLISGDLVEMRYLLPSTVKFIADCFESVRPTKVVVLPGNHDPFADNSFHNSSLFGDNVYFFSPDKLKFSFDDINTDVYSVIPHNLNQNRINILMHHATIDMNFGKNPYNPIDSVILSKFAFDYIALGHFHKRFEGIGYAKRAFNPGSPEALGFDEEGSHGVYMVDIDKYGLESNIKFNFVETGIRKYKVIDIKLDEVLNDDELLESIMVSIKSRGVNLNDIIKINLIRSKTSQYIPNIVKFKNVLISRFFYVEINELTRKLYDLERIEEAGGIRGTFVRNLKRQIFLENDEEKIELMEKAIIFGLDALEHGIADLE